MPESILLYQPDTNFVPIMNNEMKKLMTKYGAGGGEIHELKFGPYKP